MSRQNQEQLNKSFRDAVVRRYEHAAIAALEKGADPEVIIGQGTRALHLAAEDGLAKLARALLKHRADKDAVNKEYATPLIIASGYNQKDVFECLLKAGAKINAQTLIGWTALHSAGIHKETDLAKLALRYKARHLPLESDGRYPVHVAAEHDRAAVLSLFLENGGDIESRDMSGKTPLMYAANEGAFITFCNLMKAGADPMARDDDGRTVVHYAQAGGDEGIVTLLNAQISGDHARRLKSACHVRRNRKIS